MIRNRLYFINGLLAAALLVASAPAPALARQQGQKKDAPPQFSGSIFGGDASKSKDSTPSPEESKPKDSAKVSEGSKSDADSKAAALAWKMEQAKAPAREAKTTARDVKADAPKSERLPV